MNKLVKDQEWIFWTTIAISFVLLVHNGTEPLFLIAYSLIPVLILFFYHKKSFIPLIIYLLLIGIFGRYTRYFRESYASDTLPAIRDFIGYFVHGKNVYAQNIMAQNGLTPFTYLPFSLFWYLPAYILKIDLRFFEMLVSCLVPIVFSFIMLIVNKFKMLPFLAIISLTPFLLDLSADGSNDNSAIFILLVSIFFLVYALKKNSKKLTVLSAIVLGLSLAFKHYIFFYLLFFIPFLLRHNKVSRFSNKKYLVFMFGTAALISLPFIIASPTGFAKSLMFIEIANRHKIWGWNIWVALKMLWQINLSIFQMWLIRTIFTGIAMVILLMRFKFKKLNEVFIASVTMMFVYLMLSQWTTYAYFTFLVPLICLSTIEMEKE